MEEEIVNIKIHEIPPREHDDIYELKNSYFKEPLLLEVYEAVKRIAPLPHDPMIDIWISDWHYCNIFGYRYTHGYIGVYSDDAFWEKYRLYCKRRYEEIYGNKFDIKDSYSREKMTSLMEKEMVRYEYECQKQQQDIILDTIKNKFLRYDIISSILAFGINPEKFWYVFIWVMDYVNTKTKYVYEKADLPLIELEKLVDFVENAKSKRGYHYFGDLQLTSSIGKDRTLKITNPHTIELMSKLIKRYLETYDKSEYSEDWCELHHTYIKKTHPDPWCPPDTTNLKQTYQLYLFHKYMNKYLEDKKGKKNCIVGDFISELKDTKIGKTEKVSIDKLWLISRLAYIAGFGIKEELYDITNKARLKDKLKKFNPDSFKRYIGNTYHY